MMVMLSPPNLSTMIHEPGYHQHWTKVLFAIGTALGMGSTKMIRSAKRCSAAHNSIYISGIGDMNGRELFIVHGAVTGL